ncbi:MAG: DUF2029 domain-containing protein [Anaerolineaceae bacterium]|nr:DUF2029 domain-containing protein [Anaerolineaceae bacterium]
MNLISRRRNYFIWRVLWLALGAAVVYLLSQAQMLSRDVLQMDFTAFYTAGESLNAGLSPYLNHIAGSPPIWDGTNPFVFSRFQYPPPAAILFQVLALLPFLTAKYAWVILSMIAVLLSVILASRFFPLRATWQWLVVCIVICVFFPLHTLIERGQIDAITLLLLTLSVYWMVRKKPGEAWLAGLAIALAILLKVYCVFLLPFLLLRRRWATLAGVICGLVGLLAVSYIHPGGRMMWREYIQDVLPRISYHHEGLIQERVDEEYIQQIRGDVGEDATIKDGRVYRLSGFNFSSNASLVRVLLDEFFEQDARISRSLLSLLVFLALSLPFIPWLLRSGAARTVDRKQEFLFWMLLMVVILLAAPLTWTMNVVWLLPFVVILISGWRDPGQAGRAIPLLVMAAGIIFATLPDHKMLALVDYFEKTWLNHKYVISEILVLLGGITLIWSMRSGLDKARDSHISF